MTINPLLILILLFTFSLARAEGIESEKTKALGGAAGTAVGMAPYAHLAIYKVCFGPDCPESDILAGLDAAVADGVDVISISLGEEENVPFFQDNIAIASFAAVQKGIFVSCATGNSGPINGTATNVAPWVLTVGASTTDRKIKATAKLGNQKEFDGESLFQPRNFPSTLAPLVYAGANDKQDSKLCVNGSLEDLVNVKGQLNYPSFAVKLGSSQTFTRTVTNVGEPYTSYTVAVAAPKGVAVTVSPNKINFTRMNEKATYSVMFSRKNEKVGEYSQGYITWVSTKYMVRSVISVNFK
ncbi:hypothetical protein L2E82_47460 [Cichorium intybus]|uniref:Uncharacterized protein n=1 Tax=Cichorium intybus TaxID=13427 RepID=A0ACB8YZQ4_CICIN|nr:hypothetical protein L2E82_47460 [Cichorium intybus]